MHSHLLPGVDDGSPDVTTSIELIGGLRALGFQRFVTTPHIYHELYNNNPSTLQPAYARLRDALDDERIELDIRYAAEYFLDDTVDEMLSAKLPLLTIKDNLVLVEVSFIQPPMDLDRRLFDLGIGGYRPIMAHPERYPYWHGDRQMLHELKERGLLFQVNLLSLCGYYGSGIARAAAEMIKAGLVDLVGTDCHHLRHVAALTRSADDIVKMLSPLVQKDKLLNAQL